jgi:hypothetical protein
MLLGGGLWTGVMLRRGEGCRITVSLRDGPAIHTGVSSELFCGYLTTVSLRVRLPNCTGISAIFDELELKDFWPVSDSFLMLIVVLEVIELFAAELVVLGVILGVVTGARTTSVLLGETVSEVVAVFSLKELGGFPYLAESPAFFFGTGGGAFRALPELDVEPVDIGRRGDTLAEPVDIGDMGAICREAGSFLLGTSGSFPFEAVDQLLRNPCSA